MVDTKQYNAEFYLVWESSCRNFIEEVNFASQDAKSSLKLHVFLRKDTPAKALPPRDSWLENHYSFTTSPYASNTGLIAHLLRKYGDFDDLDDEEILQTRVYLISERDREFEELIAILKALNRNLNVQEINGMEKDIFGVLTNSCNFCRLVFSSAEETEEHNLEKHDFFCDNSKCYGHRQRFCSEETLAKHRASQTTCPNCSELFCSEELKRVHMRSEHNILFHNALTEKKATFSKQAKIVQSALKIRISCQFCPQKEFLSLDQKEIHMKHSHKKCNCSCGQYFETREEYLDHFYSVYPLPCYENRKCPQRFQSVYYQALHHRDFHNSQAPFYCVPCQQRKVENDLEKARKTCFKDDKSLRIHGFSLGHNETEMFLLDSNSDESLKVAQTAVQRKSPTRTCSNLNYC